MTESEWLAGDDPLAMLRWIGGPHPAGVVGLDRTGAPYSHRVTERKLRLFACAASVLCGGHARDRADIVAEHADMILRAELWAETGVRGDEGPHDDQWHAMDETGDQAARGVVGSISAMRPASLPHVADLLREIVGNPFRPAARWEPHQNLLSRGWWVRQIEALAHAAYDLRQPDGTLDPARLAVLSDALEEAGCTDEALLRHLRGWEPCHSHDPVRACDVCHDTGWQPLRGPHVRGCHVLDLILGKE